MTPIPILDSAGLAEGIRAICAVEPRFQAVVDVHGLPSLRHAEGGLEGLLHIVTEQFLSLAAAYAIWKRLAMRLQPFNALQVLGCDLDELKALGLSTAKARSFHHIAGLVQSGNFVPGDLAGHSDKDAHAKLLALPGVGPWTAEIYLLSVLQRADVWPWGDVALQVAAQDIFRLPTRPGKAEMIALAEPFRPWRAVLARLLWSHYRDLKGVKQA